MTIIIDKSVRMVYNNIIEKEVYMIGLAQEIKSRTGNVQRRNEEVTTTNIAKIIGVSYNTAVRKLEKNTFTVEEALKIFTVLDFKSKNKFDGFVYLFTEQPNKE